MTEHLTVSDLANHLHGFLGEKIPLEQAIGRDGSLMGQDDRDRLWARFQAGDETYEVEWHFRFAHLHRDPAPFFEVCVLRPWPPPDPNGNTYRIVEHQRFPARDVAEARRILKGEA